MGLGAFPTSDDQCIGMLGMHGTYEANHSMHKSDLLLCVGARFDDRITGKVSGFYFKKNHMDIDASSFNKSVNVDVTVQGDLYRILSAINNRLKIKKLFFKK